MRIKDFELEAKTFDNLTIELEDEYMYMNFYKYQKADFNYIKRRYEEKVLVIELNGYSEYKKKVKYRIIPFIW